MTDETTGPRTAAGRLDSRPSREAQEAIQIIEGDYYGHLRRMVTDARKRPPDPTLAIALSVDALGLLLDEVGRARALDAEHEPRPTSYARGWAAGAAYALDFERHAEAEQLHRMLPRNHALGEEPHGQ